MGLKSTVGARRAMLPARRGFTLLEVMIVTAIIAVLASVALVAYNGMVNMAHLGTITATAKVMRSTTRTIGLSALHAQSMGGCRRAPASFEYSYDGNTGEVCMRPDLTGVPIGTVGFIGTSTNSEQLWDLLVSDPPIRTDESGGVGWYATAAGDCPSDTSFTYCWAYRVGGDALRLIRYNNDDEGSVEILSP